METGPRLKVSSDRLVKPGIEPATPGLQGKRFIHYTTAAPTTITLPIFFDGIIKRTHFIANKKSTQNTPNLQIKIISVKL